ncbi:MAG: TlpA disulfide reductase family protein [Dysgonomonas sp.]|nr:TlpA disulfide reductase family protein [Dysgonomonas sp.]
MKIFRLLTLVVFIITILNSCSDKGPQFIVEGKIADADSSLLFLEKRELDKITFLDSIRLDQNGEFKFAEATTNYPEFYVLHLNGQVINFAVDSVETVKINASKNTFATEYTIEGNQTNQLIKEATLAQYKASSELNKLQQRFSNKEINETDFITEIQGISNQYKETAQKIIFTDLLSPAAYFALFQKVNGLLFFDPYDKSDYRMFAAVATSWDNTYKDSPRAIHLRDYTLAAMKIRKQEEKTPANLDSIAKEVDATQYYNIELPDVNSKNIALSSLKGKTVLLDFTVYQSENSPAHNIALNRIYNKFKSNLEIYQVSFDADVHFWRNAAINLPWVAVHDNKSVNSDLIFKYNIQGFPTIFLIGKDGNLVKRLLPTDNIEAEIAKII